MNVDLIDRTRRFAFAALSLCAHAPKRYETQHIVQQLLRSSSSVAANYRAACRARSKAEFISKLGIVEEECDESQFWLEFLRGSVRLLGIKLDEKKALELDKLIREADELVRIIIASKKTARGSS